jgi:TIR domain-containing protein
MGRWFLSYNAQDLSLHQQIEARLRSLPGTDLFYAPASLRAGGYWLPTLADEINTADAFLLLIGEKGLGPWQVLEYYEALDRRVKQPGFPVIVLLLQGPACARSALPAPAALDRGARPHG